jgi:hypothetical protein
VLKKFLSFFLSRYVCFVVGLEGGLVLSEKYIPQWITSEASIALVLIHPGFSWFVALRNGNWRGIL